MITKEKRQALVQKKQELMLENLMIADILKQPPESRKVSQCKTLAAYL